MTVNCIKTREKKRKDKRKMHIEKKEETKEREN
jgi:hypothetical protein